MCNESSARGLFTHLFMASSEEKKESVRNLTKITNIRPFLRFRYYDSDKRSMQFYTIADTWFSADMILTRFYVIVSICFPLVVDSGDRSAEYDNDVYFEVLEPSKHLQFSIIDSWCWSMKF